jgi:hypothetical protein
MNQCVFEVGVKGEMSAGLCAEFADVDIRLDHGVTRLRLTSADDARLHGILDRLDSLGLELLDVHRVEVADRLAGSDDHVV